MRGIQARIDDIFNKANGGKAERLSETDDTVAATEKPAQVLKTIQPTLTRPHSTAYLSEVLQARQEQIEDRQKAQRTAFTTGMGRERFTVSDVHRRARSAATIDLTVEQKSTPVDTKITSSSRIFKSDNSSRQGSFTSGAEPYLPDERSSKMHTSRHPSGRPFLSSTGSNYGHPICIDEDNFILSSLSSKSRKVRSVPSFKNKGPVTEEEARRDLRAEQEMHKEAAKMEKNLAIKRQAARDNEVKARNKRLRLSLVSGDASPIITTAIRRGVQTSQESPLSRPFGHQIPATSHDRDSLVVLKDTPSSISGGKTTTTILDDLALTSENANPDPALRSALDTPEHTSILSPMTVVDNSLTNPLMPRVDVPKCNEGEGASENWYKRFITPEESRLFPDAHHNGSNNPCSLVFSKPSSSTDLLCTANVLEGGLFGNRLLSFEQPLSSPKAGRVGPGNLNPLVFPDTSPSSGPQIQIGNIHKPTEDEGVFEQESLFFPEPNPGRHTALSESATENGHHHNVVGTRVSTGIRAKALETAESALVHSDEIDSLCEHHHDAETGREIYTPLIQPSSFKQPKPSCNDGNAGEEHTGKQSAASFRKDPQEAVDLRHVQKDIPNVERKSLKLEHPDCRTDVRLSVEDLHDADPGIQHTQAPVGEHNPNHEECRKDASLKPKPGQSKIPGATTCQQTTTTPEREEVRETSLKKCEERKRDALGDPKGQTSLKPLNTLRRSPSENTHAPVHGDHFGTANSPPETTKDEGLVTVPRRRRMSTPERKEAKRRAMRKFQAKKKMEKMAQEEQRSSVRPGTSTQPSSRISNNSSEDKNGREDQLHSQSRIPGHDPSLTTPHGPCEDAQKDHQSHRPTTARKGIAKKTILPPTPETAHPTVAPSASPESTEQDDADASDVPDPDPDSTNEEMLFHYHVHRTERRLDNDDPAATPPPTLSGPYHTLAEANAVASAALLAFPSPHSYTTPNHGGWHTDPHGLQTWHFASPTASVAVAVTRTIQRRARLPRHAARIPPRVYEAYERRVECAPGPAGDKTFAHVHRGTFTLLDLANRQAARAWVAVVGAGLPDTAFTWKVARPGLEAEMRGVCEELEGRGGFFRRRAWVGEGEVEVWVAEREVLGPRN